LLPREEKKRIKHKGKVIKDDWLVLRNIDWVGGWCGVVRNEKSDDDVGKEKKTIKGNSYVCVCGAYKD
jgi:hypothetical protein